MKFNAYVNNDTQPNKNTHSYTSVLTIFNACSDLPKKLKQKVSGDDVREGLGTAGEQLAGALFDPPALPDLPEGVAVKRTQAAYYVGDPGLPDDWMVFFTIITAQDDEDSQALVDSLLALSDAIVQSVRFS